MSTLMGSRAIGPRRSRPKPGPVGLGAGGEICASALAGDPVRLRCHDLRPHHNQRSGGSRRSPCPAQRGLERRSARSPDLEHHGKLPHLSAPSHLAPSDANFEHFLDGDPSSAAPLSCHDAAGPRRYPSTSYRYRTGDQPSRLRQSPPARYPNTTLPLGGSNARCRPKPLTGDDATCPSPMLLTSRAVDLQESGQRHGVVGLDGDLPALPRAGVDTQVLAARSPTSPDVHLLAGSARTASYSRCICIGEASRGSSPTSSLVLTGHR